MLVKTSQLTDLALDWAVTKCETPPEGYKRWFQDRLDTGENSGHPYSTDPVLCADLLSAHIFKLEDLGDYEWEATAAKGCVAVGTTWMEAVCRAYVTYNLGDEVEIPERLLK